ncbi:Z1 domain-containing protein [Marinococcus luteus]|uniref:Z1 domain-containing protein n=2 Tax=Marinococcus luteus TaxID=1122204 RepID=A0A1H2QFJ6_9BACI|nr:Z1 domain-containing protein [Marinococcus luteus]
MYLTDMKYDAQRDWIKNQRRHGHSWEKLSYAKRDSPEKLEEFLKSRVMDDHWEEISINEWYELVKSIKKVEDSSIEARERDKSASITDGVQNNTLDIPKDSESSWQIYKNKLWEKGFTEVAINEIETSCIFILKRLSSNTKDSGPIKGLVVGNVQSGKTANMAGLMAMASDHGWNTFIVLSGLVENLRKQTQDRLIEDLHNSGNVSWYSLSDVKGNAPSGRRAQDFEFKEAKAHLYVCLKNSKWLKGLLDWMYKDLKQYSRMKILVIDDEADQGSINTADIESNVRKTINRLIVNLVEGKNKQDKVVATKPQAMNYISYTATPYANFLNEYSRESLYPRNFIHSLSTTNEYFGPKEIFGIRGSEDFEGMNITRTIYENDINQIKDMHKGNKDLPNSLKEAISWFLCAVASLRLHNFKKPLTMMVHSSHKQDDHKNTSYAIKNWLKNEKESIIFDLCKEVWNKETKSFTKKDLLNSYENYSGNKEKILEFQPFLEILPEIKMLIKEVNHIAMNEEGEPSYSEHVHLCVDNSANNGINYDGNYMRLLYPDSKKVKEMNRAPAFIVVGGTTLSRGLTMEGLVSTYFLRNTKQADTLMQMGRWFGYRPRYELYPRIWMTENTKEQFEFLSTLEYELRATLEEFSKASKDPSAYAPRVKNTPAVSWMRVTASDRQQAATEIEVDYTGFSPQTIIFNNEKKEQLHNINVTENFLFSLAEIEGANNSSENQFIWKNVSFDFIAENLLKKMVFHPRMRTFNKDELNPFIEWVKEKTKEDELNNWNVIVSGKKINNLKENEIWNLPLRGKVGKVTRNRKSTFEDEKSINIGVLRDPSDLYADINFGEEDKKEISKIKSKAHKIGGVDEVRAFYGLGDTPQLIIYRIDKNSKTNAERRENLEAEEDIIGICLRIPGMNSKNGNSYGALQIQIENYDETKESEVNE